MVRKRVRVTGTVQGVGFRPHVHHLATGLGLRGFVLNDSRGVLIEVEGSPEVIEGFRVAVVEGAPPLASIESLEVEDLPPIGDESFVIRPTPSGGRSDTPISPDIATCDECLAEISDPDARRFRYPFTNCTDCGPRFTITMSTPYDRVNTTMRAFEMCDLCRREYEDPRDRRFHAQPIACPDCGPQLELLDPAGTAIEGDPIAEAARFLARGAIVAIKGLGGFHLACDARTEDVVAELRRRKHRDEKPLAVMVTDLVAATGVGDISDDAAAEMISGTRPIVLVPRKDVAGGNEPLAEGVSPGNRFVGLMLPYTPLHHLLMRALDHPIVMTSGNLSDEPMVTTTGDAMQRLVGIADAFLVHDRDIYMRCDDSVIRVEGDIGYPIRRSRGYAPGPLLMTRPFPKTVLAVGAELKNTFCLGIGRRATLSHHIGDLENYEANSAFMAAIAHFIDVYEAELEVVAHDMHPEYLSTKWALGSDIEEKVAVQHHHAHIASCLADNGREDRVIGLALDGTGYGDDGHIWGCEVLSADLESYRRAAHLAYIPLPGGAAAVKQPWRMAAVYLQAAFGDAVSDLSLGVAERNASDWAPILAMADKGINSPLNSSAGRLFDAMAALCGLRDVASYEGQAAAELEQIANQAIEDSYPCRQIDGIISGVDLVAAAAEELATGCPPSDVSARFHNGLARALLSASMGVREEEGLSTVALSGGTWQNLFLARRTRAMLMGEGFEVLTHRRVPPNDGGISLGQAVVAAAGTERRDGRPPARPECD
ncbi:MAG: carbamoyltransferase HypF [Actinomycetota bacterium]